VSKNKHILVILILVTYFNNMNVSFDVLKLYCSKKKSYTGYIYCQMQRNVLLSMFMTHMTR